jgi:translation initiation factor 1A
MPNLTGGKSYKKTKHGNNDETAIFIDRQADQMYGRIIKNLGGLNLLVFCNDNYERVCHIRGAMRKRVWLHTGDIVLISIRDFNPDKKSDGKERGDIIAKYDHKHYSKLRRLSDFNEILLNNIEQPDRKDPTNDGFEMELSDGTQSDNEEIDELQKSTHINKRSDAPKIESDEIDIDNI